MENLPGQFGPDPRQGQAVHQRGCRREQSQSVATPPHTPLMWPHTASRQGEVSGHQLLPRVATCQLDINKLSEKREPQLRNPRQQTACKQVCREFSLLTIDMGEPSSLELAVLDGRESREGEMAHWSSRGPEFNPSAYMTVPNHL